MSIYSYVQKSPSMNAVNSAESDAIVQLYLKDTVGNTLNRAELGQYIIMEAVLSTKAFSGEWHSMAFSG